MVFGGWFDEPQPKRARPRFTPKEKEALFKLQGGKCNGCGKKFDLRNFAVDQSRCWKETFFRQRDRHVALLLAMTKCVRIRALRSSQ